MPGYHIKCRPVLDLAVLTVVTIIHFLLLFIKQVMTSVSSAEVIK